MKKIFLTIFILVLFFISFDFAQASAKASLYLSPNSGTFFVGSTFDVSVFVNTGDNNINAVKADLKFDPKKIQIASPATGKSFISVWIAQPTYSNIEGTISFQGGTPSPGINTSAGLVSTITFRAVAPGETVISILDSSKVLLDDGEGSNILSSVSKGNYQVLIPPPEGPQIYSSTHPDQNSWYRNNNPIFSWDKEEGVTDFSYSIDSDFHGVPDNESEGEGASISYENLEDGAWYFHVKAKKGGSWGGTSNYLAQIDTTPPADFKIEFEPKSKSGKIMSQQPIAYFFTTDNSSGVDYFSLKLINLTKETEKGKTEFFIEAVSPYKLSFLEPGEYQLVVRAYDKATNYRDVSEKIEITPNEKMFYVTEKGINLERFFLKWNVIFSILLIFIVCIIIALFLLKRRQERIFLRMEALKKLREKTQYEGQKIENKLYEK